MSTANEDIFDSLKEQIVGLSGNIRQIIAYLTPLKYSKQLKYFKDAMDYWLDKKPSLSPSMRKRPQTSG